jgi:hypothetical protein
MEETCGAGTPRLAVGEVALYSEGESDMVAHATGTYSIPAHREAATPDRG